MTRRACRPAGRTCRCEPRAGCAGRRACSRRASEENIFYTRCMHARTHAHIQRTHAPRAPLAVVSATSQNGVWLPIVVYGMLQQYVMCCVCDPRVFKKCVWVGLGCPTLPGWRCTRTLEGKNRGEEREVIDAKKMEKKKHDDDERGLVVGRHRRPVPNLEHESHDGGNSSAAPTMPHRKKKTALSYITYIR